MGLIKAAIGAGGGVLADQWREYFYCESIPEDVMMVKGEKRNGDRSSNTRGTDNIITNGSIVAVADGQCMMIVDQGRLEACCDVPGEYIYDTSTEPTIFVGGLGQGIKKSFATFARRFTFGGEPAKDQRVYYFNTKELVGNKYGTPSPVPFRVVDKNIGLDVDISIRCFGEYTYHICDPVLFYKNVCGNVTDEFERERIDSTLKSEVMSALQPTFAKISEMGIRYSALPGHTTEMEQAINEVLSEKWRELRGLEIVSFSVASVKASEEDEKMIKELQRSAAFRNPNMAAAHLVGAQAEAMKSAAANENGAMMGFMGMGLANQMGGFNSQQLYQMGQQQPQQPNQPTPPPAAPAAPQADSWKCSCGETVVGNFCPNCGSKKPEPKPAADAWVCSCGETVTGKFCPNCGAKRPEAKPVGWTCPTCGQLNKGKFCSECGTKKPADALLYRCDKCGWEPEDPAHPPKFCPECGDPFDESDVK